LNLLVTRAPILKRPQTNPLTELWSNLRVRKSHCP
jgi:hypothetical protein